MIIVNFNKDDVYANGSGLWQWDYGQILRIQGLKLPAAVEIHFSLSDTGGESVTRVGTTKDGVTDVIIPDSMLESGGMGAGYNIYAYIYLTDDASGESVYKITLPVKARPKPEAFDKPEDAELFREAVKAVNDAADRADDAAERAGESAKKAASEAVRSEEAAARSEQSAGKSATSATQSAQAALEAEKSAEETAGMKQEVSGMLEKVEDIQKDVAEDALSVQEDLEEVQRLAEQAAQDREQTGKDAQATAADRVQTGKDAASTAGDRRAVELLADGFTLTAQQAVVDVNNAGQTQVERVEETGDAQVSAVNAAGAAQKKAVEDAGTANLSAVNTAGETQVLAVQTEGTTQVANVQQAAAEIVADREQIKTNTEAIAKNVRAIGALAPGIKMKASGRSMLIKDGSGQLVQGLNLYGRSEQTVTTGAQLVDSQTILSSTASAEVIGNDIKLTALSAGSYRQTKSLKLARIPTGRNLYVTGKVLNNSNPANVPVVVIRSYNASGEMTQEINAIINSVTKEAIADEATEIVAVICMNAGNIAVAGDTLTIENFMISDSDVSWEPYTGGKPSPSPDYPQPIVSAGDSGEIEVDVMGKNLYNFDWFGMYKSNATESKKENDRFVFKTNGKTMIAGIYQQGGMSDLPLRNQLLRCRPNRKYIFSYECNIKNGIVKKCYVQLYGENGDYIQKFLVVTDSKIEFETGNNAHWLVCNVQLEFQNDIVPIGTEVVIHDVMLKEADAEGAYEPYKHQSVPIPTPNGLPGIPVSSGGNYTDEDGQQWVCDSIEYRDGQAVYVQRVKEVIFDGSTDELWNVQSSDNGKGFANYEISLKGKKEFERDGRCNRFVYDIHSIAYVSSEGFHYNGLYFFLRVSTSRFSGTIENLRNFLKENNVVFLYALETPIITDLPVETLTAFTALHTNYPTTTITNDADAWMDVEYVADTKTYIDNQLTEIRNALVDTQAHII